MESRVRPQGIEDGVGTAAVVQDAGTSLVAGLGSLAVPMGLHFPPNSRPTVIVFTVQFVDDRGNRVSSAVSVTVT